MEGDRVRHLLLDRLPRVRVCSMTMRYFVVSITPRENAVEPARSSPAYRRQSRRRLDDCSVDVPVGRRAGSHRPASRASLAPRGGRSRGTPASSPVGSNGIAYLFARVLPTPSVTHRRARGPERPRPEGPVLRDRWYLARAEERPRSRSSWRARMSTSARQRVLLQETRTTGC
jgi:hypothetical protein